MACFFLHVVGPLRGIWRKPMVEKGHLPASCPLLFPSHLLPFPIFSKYHPPVQLNVHQVPGTVLGTGLRLWSLWWSPALGTSHSSQWRLEKGSILNRNSIIYYKQKNSNGSERGWVLRGWATLGRGQGGPLGVKPSVLRRGWSSKDVGKEHPGRGNSKYGSPGVHWPRHIWGIQGNLQGNSGWSLFYWSL